MPRSDYGNGAPCPDNPAHGRMFVLSSGREWCPNPVHDGPLRRPERSTEDMALGQTGPAPKPGKREKAERPKEAARAEVKKPRATAAPKETPLCKCGCGEHTKGGTFRPGHDARFHAAEKAAKAAAEQPVAQ